MLSDELDLGFIALAAFNVTDVSDSGIVRHLVVFLKDRCDHDTLVEGAVHLGLVNLAEFLGELEDGRSFPEAAV